MMALNTTTGKGGWKAFKGKCNKCGKQGHKACNCNTGHGETKNTNSNKTFPESVSSVETVDTWHVTVKILECLQRKRYVCWYVCWRF